MEHRRRTHRRCVAVLAAAGAAALLGAGPAQASSDDQRFSDAVATLNIPMAPDVDVPKVGRDVCDMITTGRSQTIDPVRTIRGVVGALENSGMNRNQAVGVMRAAVAVYCPEHGSVIGRLR